MILTLSLAADTFNEEVIIVLVKKSMPDIWDPEYKPTKKDKLPKKPKDASQNEEVPFGFGRTTAKPPARLNVATRNDVDKAAGLAAKFEDFFHNLKLKYSDDGVPESSLNIMFDELANLHVSLAKSINDKDLEDEGDKILDALEPALFSGAFVIFDDPRLKVIQGECNDFLDKYRSAISSIPLRQRDKRSLVRKFFSFNDVALQVAGAAGLVSAAGALALAQHKLVGASVSVLSDRMADVITKRFIKVSKAISEVPRLDIRLDKAEQSTWASAPVGGVLYPLAKVLLAAVAGAGATYSIMADRLIVESEAKESKEKEARGKQQTSSDEENGRLKGELKEALSKNPKNDANPTIESEAMTGLRLQLAQCQQIKELNDKTLSESKTLQGNAEAKIKELEGSKENAAQEHAVEMHRQSQSHIENLESFQKQLTTTREQLNDASTRIGILTSGQQQHRQEIEATRQNANTEYTKQLQDNREISLAYYNTLTGNHKIEAQEFMKKVEIREAYAIQFTNGLLAENAKLQADLNGNSILIQNLNESNVKLQRQAQEQTSASVQKLSDLQNEQHNLQEALQKNKDLQEMNNLQEQKVNVLLKQNKNHVEELKGYIQEGTKLKESNEKFIVEQKKLKEDHIILHTLYTELQSKQKDMRILSQQLEECNKNHKTELENIKSQLKTRTEEVSSLNERLIATIQNHHEEYSKWEIQIAGLQKDIQDLHEKPSADQFPDPPIVEPQIAMKRSSSSRDRPRDRPRDSSHGSSREKPRERSPRRPNIKHIQSGDRPRGRSSSPSAEAQDFLAPSPSAEAQESPAPSPSAEAQESPAPSPNAEAQNFLAPSPSAEAQESPAPSPSAEIRLGDIIVRKRKRVTPASEDLQKTKKTKFELPDS